MVATTTARERVDEDVRPVVETLPLGEPRASRWRAESPAWTWLGVGVCVVGFALIALAWGQVAGEADVYRQLPYVVSAAFVGLGLVMVGLTVVNVASRMHDARRRDEQVDQLAVVLAELRQVLSEPPRSGRR